MNRTNFLFLIAGQLYIMRRHTRAGTYHIFDCFLSIPMYNIYLFFTGVLLEQFQVQNMCNYFLALKCQNLTYQ